MAEIIFEVSDKVELSTVRLGLSCKKCGHSWAVYLRGGKIPWGGDECSNCKLNEVKEKEAIYHGNPKLS